MDLMFAVLIHTDVSSLNETKCQHSFFSIFMSLNEWFNDRNDSFAETTTAFFLFDEQKKQNQLVFFQVTSMFLTNSVTRDFSAFDDMWSNDECCLMDKFEFRID